MSPQMSHDQVVKCNDEDVISARNRFPSYIILKVSVVSPDTLFSFQPHNSYMFPRRKSFGRRLVFQKVTNVETF